MLRNCGGSFKQTFSLLVHAEDPPLSIEKQTANLRSDKEPRFGLTRAEKAHHVITLSGKGSYAGGGSVAVDASSGELGESAVAVRDHGRSSTVSYLKSSRCCMYTEQHARMQ